MKVTLITGASGGIGEALASKLAQRKQNLLLVARNAGKLSLQCKQLTETFGIGAQFIAADLAQPKAAEAMFAGAQLRGLEIDTLINNAGIGSGGEFSTIKLQPELNLIQLNVSSLVALTHLVLPQMQQRKSGTIINVASMAALMPVPYMATYAASKAFVRSFTEAITEECKPYGIHVLLFCPGLTKTGFNQAAGINNETAKGLGADYSNAPAQTPEAVADEILNAIDKRKHVAIAGARNRIAAKALALLPDSLIALNLANSYRKKLNR